LRSFDNVRESNGVAAIILPSSILSNGNIYESCRVIILENFYIVAIAQSGSGAKICRLRPRNRQQKSRRPLREK